MNRLPCIACGNPAFWTDPLNCIECRKMYQTLEEVELQVRNLPNSGAFLTDTDKSNWTPVQKQNLIDFYRYLLKKNSFPFRSTALVDMNSTFHFDNFLGWMRK